MSIFKKYIYTHKLNFLLVLYLRCLDVCGNISEHTCYLYLFLRCFRL